MSGEARLLVTSAHADARARKLYPTGCYMASNPDEYWAEGTQARPGCPHLVSLLRDRSVPDPILDYPRAVACTLIEMPCRNGLRVCSVPAVPPSLIPKSPTPSSSGRHGPWL
jgi:hypothetical protein